MSERRPRRRLHRLAAWAALFVALFLSACATPLPSDSTPDLACRLEPRPPLTAGGPVRVRFEIANRSDAPVWVLNWNTPLEGWRGTLFAVTRRNGEKLEEREELPYQGPMMKRGAPGRGDYVEIAAGGRVEATVDLAEVYDLTRPGRYRVAVDRDLLDATSDAASLPRDLPRHQAIPLRCEPLEIAVSDG